VRRVNTQGIRAYPGTIRSASIHKIRRRFSKAGRSGLDAGTQPEQRQYADRSYGQSRSGQEDERQERPQSSECDFDNKGEKTLQPAAPADWEFIQKVLLTLPDGDRHALSDTLELVKCEAFSYLHPELDKANIIKNSFTNQPGLYERMIKNIVPSNSETRHHGKKKKP
jgi:hypothetical protein